MLPEKKTYHRFFISFFMIVFLFIPSVFLFSGCASTPPSRYYSLAPVETQAITPGAVTKSRNTSAPLVGIGPLQLAKYLDRTQIVIRTTPNRVEISEFDQWISSLEDQISLAMQENLSALLATNRIIRYPWKRRSEPDFQVSIEVIRMDGILEKEIRLLARWQLYRKGEFQPMASKKSDITEPFSGKGFDTLARAYSNALGKLCRAIAMEIDMTRQKTYPY